MKNSRTWQLLAIPALTLALGAPVTAFAAAAKSATPHVTITNPRYYDDAAISARVKEALAQSPDLKPFDLEVGTRQGVVRLGGTVDWKSQEEKAAQLALATDGTMAVRDNIKIRGVNDAGQPMGQ